MVKFAADIHPESIVDVEGTISSTTERILSCSHQTVELWVTKVFVVSQAAAQLPLQIEDAMRPDNSEGPSVNQDTRLNNRVIDLRANSVSLFYINSTTPYKLWFPLAIK